MNSPLMRERRQFENWGRPLGGTDFLVYGARGEAPMLLTIGPNVTEKARRALYRVPTANLQIFRA